MRVAFCGGGTGGHVYPALTVAAALQHMFEGEKGALRVGQGGEGAPLQSSLELLYVGVRGRIDRDLVQRENIPFEAVTAGPLRVGSLSGTARGGIKLLGGTAEAYSVLSRFRPDVVFATGGFGSVGVGLAARLRRLPLLLFLPDVEAGLAVRTLARIADRIAVTVPPAELAMPSAKTVLTGYPVRPAFYAATRDEGRRRLNLDPTLPVLLVSGASTGASSLNKAIASSLDAFLALAQVVHLSGPNDEPSLRARAESLPADLKQRYHLYSYLHEDMAYALAAADLAVMRSGASTLGELPATRLPAVLVPGEYEGWDQSPNARFLATMGAAVMLPQAQLADLLPTVAGLLADTQRLSNMRQALAQLARPDAAERLANLIVSMAKPRQAVAA